MAGGWSHRVYPPAQGLVSLAILFQTLLMFFNTVLYLGLIHWVRISALSDLAVLQVLQDAMRLDSVSLPPLAFGIIWSMVVASDPQYWHVWLSLARICNLSFFHLLPPLEWRLIFVDPHPA